MSIKACITGWVCAIAIIIPPMLTTSKAQNPLISANIALGKKVTAIPAPNSGDTGNKLELLTDGNPQSNPVVSQGSTSLWVQPTAVGWSRSPISCLIVDLESVRPISGFSYHTAAGIADVSWPGAIYVLISDDQKNWRFAGDLVMLSAKNGVPPAYGQYHEHSFSTRDVRVTGRYVAFGITSSLYTVTDELQVYAGDEAWLGEPDESILYENQPASLVDYMRLLSVQDGINRRLTRDLDAIKSSIERSTLPPAKKSRLQKQATAALASSTKPALPPVDFRAVLPINDVHRQILGVHGELLAAQGFEPLTVWNRHRFEWLDFMSAPDKKQSVGIHFNMLGGQFRSQSLLLTNATGKPRQVTLKLTGAPRGARSGWLQLDEVIWTDTYHGVPVPDALRPLTLSHGAYTVEVPAGVTRKLWLTVDSSRLSPGNYRSTLQVESGPFRKQVALDCSILPLSMRRPRLSLGMWDESNGIESRNSYAINAKNYSQALKLMHSHYVDTAWGTRAALPWPGGEAFDAQGMLKNDLDFSAFDKWIKDWPEARHFFVFINATDGFAGATIDDPLFSAKVGNWAKAIVTHLRHSGRDPKQFGLMLLDESYKDETDVIQVAWSRAINAKASELLLFTDPLWVRPDQIKHQEALTNFDVLSPNLPVYQRGGVPAKNYYENLRRQGKALWFYQCDGPSRMFDPQRYYRYQAWHTFAVGGVGQGFWAFGDAGQDSWNEYSNVSYTYAPVFINKDTVTNSVHWDSVREGMQDFEELAMLRDAISIAKNVKLRQEAQRVLDEAVKNVTGIWQDKEATRNLAGALPHYDWRKSGYDVELADRQLTRVRLMLTRLRSDLPGRDKDAVINR